MKINRNELLAALDLGGKIPSNASLPIYNFVRLREFDDALEISISNGTVLYQTNITALGARDGNPRIVDRRLLTDVIKAMYEDEILITFSDSTMTLSGSYGKVQIPVSEGLGYPDFPERWWNGSETRCIRGLDHLAFQRFLRQGKKMVSKCPLRPAMTGIYIYMDESESKVGAAATDAHKLYWGCQKSLDPMPGASWAFILPPDSFGILEAVLKMTSRVEIWMTRYAIRVKYGMGSVLYIKTIDETFPAFKTVVPQREAIRYTWGVGKSDLLRAINLAAVTSNKATESVIIKATSSPEQELTLSSRDYDFDISSEQKVSGDICGGEIALGVKATFLKSIIDHISTPGVKFEVVDNNTAIIISPIGEPGTMFLLTPMMLP